MKVILKILFTNREFSELIWKYNNSYKLEIEVDWPDNMPFPDKKPHFGKDEHLIS